MSWRWYLIPKHVAYEFWNLKIRVLKVSTNMYLPTSPNGGTTQKTNTDWRYVGWLVSKVRRYGLWWITSLLDARHMWGGGTRMTDFVAPNYSVFMTMSAEGTYGLTWAPKHRGSLATPHSRKFCLWQNWKLQFASRKIRTHVSLGRNQNLQIVSALSYPKTARFFQVVLSFHSLSHTILSASVKRR
jgi:hypothetical protein